MGIFKLCFSFLTLSCANSFVAPTSMLPATSIMHNILNVGVPLIVPAHGSVDVFHALQENKTSNYLRSNLLAYVGYPLINFISDELSLFVFLSLSAYHFRHQFEFVGKYLSFIPSSALVYFGYEHQDLLYLFLAFVHTPHQYWKFRDFVLYDKIMSTLIITILTATSMCVSYSDWSNNLFITSSIISHIVYQEFFRFQD